MNRQKDIQYSSRAVSHIMRQKQIHKLRHVIAELVKRVPEAERAEIEELAAYGCLTRMHVVRLLAPRLDNEDHTKDIDFLAQRYQGPLEGGLSRHPARPVDDPHGSRMSIRSEGFYLHELRRMSMPQS